MKRIHKKILKKSDSLEDLKIPQEFYTIITFNFIMIYVIGKMLY